MDDALLRKARDLRYRTETLKKSMDAWEKQESALYPLGCGSGFTFDNRGTIATHDDAAWKAYRRASIEHLQREYDKAEAEFKRL